MNKTVEVAAQVKAPELADAFSERLARRARQTKGNLLEVFLVEDDEADAYLIERALGELPSIGKVVRAQDGVEALALVDTGQVRPDFALVDLQMPRMSGQQLLGELFRRIQVDFPIFVLTSSTSVLDVQRIYGNFANKYITKPTNPTTMKRSIDQIVRSLHCHI